MLTDEQLRQIRAAHRDALDGNEFARAIESAARAEYEVVVRQVLDALIAASDFVYEIREDLHHERIEDWYPEGANDAAEAMSESMRWIGDRCARFNAADKAITAARALLGETK